MRGKIHEPTTNRKVGQHGHCNEGNEEDYCVVVHRRKIQGTRLATLCPLVPVMSEDSEG